MPRSVQLVFLALMAVLFILSLFARRHPHVPWLQRFRIDPSAFGEEQRAHMRRISSRRTGVHLILAGIGLPAAYFAGTVAFFHQFTAGRTALVALASILCIGFGATAIRRSRG